MAEATQLAPAPPDHHSNQKLLPPPPSNGVVLPGNHKLHSNDALQHQQRHFREDDARRLHGDVTRVNNVTVSNVPRNGVVNGNGVPSNGIHAHAHAHSLRTDSAQASDVTMCDVTRRRRDSRDVVCNGGQMLNDVSMRDINGAHGHVQGMCNGLSPHGAGGIHADAAGIPADVTMRDMGGGAALAAGAGGSVSSACLTALAYCQDYGLGECRVSRTTVSRLSVATDAVNVMNGDLIKCSKFGLHKRPISTLHA